MISTSFLRQGFQRYWQDDDLVRMPFDDALRAGFKNDDAHILCELGLPDWAAPNLMIRLPQEKKWSEENLVIGEDRDDQPIVYAASSGDILIRPSAGEEVFVASGLRQLGYLFILYACMVDYAIARVGSDAFTANKIPLDLIEEFEAKAIQSVGVNKWSGSFWAKEIERLGKTNNRGRKK